MMTWSSYIQTLKVFQFCENTAIDIKSIENVSSAPIPTKKDDD
jgi:hypothetical protein